MFASIMWLANAKVNNYNKHDTTKYCGIVAILETVLFYYVYCIILTDMVARSGGQE